MYDEFFKGQIESFGSEESRNVDMASALTGKSTLDVFQALHVASSAAPYWRYGPLPDVGPLRSLMVTIEKGGKRYMKTIRTKTVIPSTPEWDVDLNFYSIIAWCPFPGPCEGNPI